MFKRRRCRTTDAAPESTAARLGRALAAPGPHDDRIGHHQTHAGNTDASKTGLAVGSAPVGSPLNPVHVLRWRACGR